jgi:hypothetical protein
MSVCTARACVRACVRVYARVCVCVCACVHACGFSGLMFIQPSEDDVLTASSIMVRDETLIPVNIKHISIAQSCMSRVLLTVACIHASGRQVLQKI